MNIIPTEAADRASAEKISELTEIEKRSEKLDMQAVRKGCESVRTSVGVAVKQNNDIRLSDPGAGSLFPPPLQFRSHRDDEIRGRTYACKLHA